MEYHCTVRELETRFFKSLYHDSTTDCGYDWILILIMKSMVLSIGKSIQKWPRWIFYLMLLVHVWRWFTLEMFLAYFLRLQFWILYYKVLKEHESCLNNPATSLYVADIKEVQSLYCSGFDLERPLMLSLSPCSDKHKQEVNKCITDFATTFSRNFSQPTLCRLIALDLFFLTLITFKREEWLWSQQRWLNVR